MSKQALYDPAVFDPNSIDPETTAFNRTIEEAMSALPPIYALPPQEIRDQRESGNSIWGPIKRLDEAQDRVVPGPAGEVPIRVFVPETVNGVYLHIHGGGFMLMRPYYFDEALAETSRVVQVAVVSVDYRLAPENPYPAAPDDCEAVAVWLAGQAKSEFGSDKLVIGGESAGANLSVVTLLRMRDRHGFSGFAGASLPYGCFDVGLTPSARNWGERNLILTTKLIEWFNGSYAPPEKWTDPDVSPLYADLSDMPPALFSVGTMDPLLDDSLFMHSRWSAAGNEAELAIYPGGAHGFPAFPIGIARQANERIRSFIASSC
jgi:acetyl esterase